MHSGWPFSLHTPFTGPLGIEPNIDYQLFPGRKSGVFTDVYKFAQGENCRCDFAGDYFFMSFFIRAKAALSSSSSGSCA